MVKQMRNRMTKTWLPMMKRAPNGKPTVSKRIPATVGPTKAPNAKTDVHNPEMRPYVSMVSGKPAFKACLCASAKPDTTWAPKPKPEKT